MKLDLISDLLPRKGVTCNLYTNQGQANFARAVYILLRKFTVDGAQISTDHEEYQGINRIQSFAASEAEGGFFRSSRAGLADKEFSAEGCQPIPDTIDDGIFVSLFKVRVVTPRLPVR